jgi:ribosomal protein L11 methyltransferase
MDTVTVTVPVPALDHDAVLAVISDWPLLGVLQENDHVDASLPAHEWTTARRETLVRWLSANGYAPELDVELHPAQNWNRTWEETITPVRVGPFLLTPTWADAPPEHVDATVIEIDPKMSFGTGHHATTRLMLRLLPRAVAPGDRVLDVGTGTGVLAIAACRLGAHAALGIDVSEPAIENATENCMRNDVTDSVSLRTGTIEVVPESGFDVITANITREVLRDLLPAFRQKVRPGGLLLLSGVFAGDRDALLAAAADHGFALHQDATEDGWWAGRLKATAAQKH